MLEWMNEAIAMITCPDLSVDLLRRIIRIEASIALAKGIGIEKKEIRIGILQTRSNIYVMESSENSQREPDDWL